MTAFKTSKLSVTRRWGALNSEELVALVKLL